MRSAVVLATLSGVLMIAQLIVAKAARDTLFLSNFPVTALPAAMVITAVIALPAVLGGSSLIARVGPHRFLPAFLLANAVGFGMEWAILPLVPRVVVAFMYLHVGLFGGLSISGFWSVVNERFDPHSAKRAFARIGFGFAIGGLLGGVLAERMATWFGVRAMLLTLVATNVVVALAVSGLGAPQSVPEPMGARPSGLKTLTSSRYLRALGLLVVMVAITSSTLDYSFKSSIATALRQPERLAKFFAIYYMATSFITVVLQATASRYSLERFGIGATLSVLPALLLLGGGLSAIVGGLWSVVLLRGTQSVLATSFFRSAYEPLYTPLAPHKKRATKAIIDVAADRLGDALGSGGIWLTLALAPNQAWPASLTIAMLAAGLSLWLSLRLQRGYVAELASSLKKGMVHVSEHDVRDATTRLTLSQTHEGINRELLMREIAAARRTHTADPEVSTTVGELVSGDPERIVRQLRSGPLDRRLVSLVIPLLEYDDVRNAVIQALQGVAAETIGQLSDALLDNDLSESARYRIPSILAKVASPRAMRALTQGLSEADFELRERCARALLAFRRRDPSLRPPQVLVLSAAKRELNVSSQIWRSRGSATLERDPSLSQIGALSSDRSLQHVFTLLCLRLNPDELELALRALGAQDAKLRGTALEYLENVVPAEVKAALWPHLADHRTVQRKAPRSKLELAEELKRSFSG